MLNVEATLDWLSDVKPVRFYPYVSIVTQHLFWEKPENLPDSIVRLFLQVKDKTLSLGARWDNKVVVECQVGDYPAPVFFGYKDGNYALGFSVYVEEWVDKSRIK